MSLLAQLICFNPLGATLSADEEAFITRNGITSFVLFARNTPDIESARALIARLHELAPEPLIAADQEGGRVTRLPPPATHLPSAMAVGAANDPALARAAGQATARELRAMRLNVALAPVLDVNINAANPVIGTRSFGETPERVAAIGVAWLRGAQAEGVAACAKHFPGHGDTRVDSHAAMPRIEADRTRLEHVELAPFRAAVAASVRMVMPGHLLMPALDAECPASLSRAILTGLLRGEIGFDGVVITDALDMDAVAATYGIPTAATEAAIAGCDLVVPIVQHAETLAVLEQAVREGRLSMAQVERSVERTRRLRAEVRVPAAFDLAGLGAAEHWETARQIAARAIQVRDTGRLLPVRDLRDWVCVEFALGKATIAEGIAAGQGKLLAQLQREHPELAGLVLPFGPDDAQMAEAQRMLVDARGLIVALRQALHFPAQQAFAGEALAAGKPVVLVAMRDPYDLDLFADAPCTIAAFDDSPAMVEAVCQRILNG
ncbi:MAG: beta-N-acetylhexosaminidase [Chloroflexi bacterium]|nr:beta-N-acetylhexosaminidase [Chloroflexota bacterium]